MPSLFVGIHLRGKPNEIIRFNDIDFERDVQHLKEVIAERLECKADNLEIVYNGLVLGDTSKLLGAIRSNGTVHCFTKLKPNAPYEPKPELASSENLQLIAKMFGEVRHAQLDAKARENMLEKVMDKFPAFRKDLAAQTIIRDKLLFKKLQDVEVLKNISETYPIICEAASFIVETVKKELRQNFDTDETSSEEESSDDEPSTSNASSLPTPLNVMSTEERMRRRQQLEARLARLAAGTRNASLNTGPSTSAAARANSARVPRISIEHLRSGLEGALGALGQRSSPNASETSSTSLGALGALGPRSSANASETASTSLGAFGALGPRSSANASVTASTLLGALGQRSSANESETPSTSLGTHSQQTEEGATGSQNTSDNNDNIVSLVEAQEYEEQLNMLGQMGFNNRVENLMFLKVTHGNLEAAINLLLGGGK